MSYYAIHGYGSMSYQLSIVNDFLIVEIYLKNKNRTYRNKRVQKSIVNRR